MTKEREFPFSKSSFDALRKRAKAHSGIMVSDDKYEMYYARLAKRLRALRMSSFKDYIALLDSDKEEFKNFINAITTNVTSFDRERHHFDFLKEALPSINTSELSVWSAGCSSGEEPYSIIINLYEYCQQQRKPLALVATDLDTDVLQRAANGVYPVKSVSDYDKTILRRFFRKGVGANAGFCRVKPEYRKLIRFSQLNLITEFRLNDTFDVIFCRNVLIYFDAERKQKIVERFAQHLKPGGLLFLGHSETLQSSNRFYRNVGKNVYQKND